MDNEKDEAGGNEAEGRKAEGKSRHADAAEERGHVDPVCHLKVAANTPYRAHIAGQEYYFCSEACRDEFTAGGGGTRCYDLVIIGGGPAGLTAAVYASLLHLDAMLLSRDIGGQAIDSTKIENYMGFDYIRGPDLAARFKNQLLNSPHLHHRMTEVTSVDEGGCGFKVVTSEPADYTARALIVATGMVRRHLDVPGEERLQRRGIFYGHVQDFAFARGLAAAVVGGGNSALQAVENLVDEAKEVHLVTHGEITADPAEAERVKRNSCVDYHPNCDVVEFVGDTRVEGLIIRDRASGRTTELSVQAVFIAVGLVTSSDLVKHLVTLNRHNEIMVGPDGATSHPGIYAAGDVSDAYGKRIVIAAGDGAKAALAVREYIRKLSRQAAAETTSGAPSDKAAGVGTSESGT
jgi:alkyl hydroperoxide reductase subunit F